MSKKLIGYGVVALAICATAGSAQAKLVRYEIDGKRYSYSTNNIQQTREARQRIEAANAASAAKARAEAERAANPIVRIFGSRAQQEAAETRARLEQSVGSSVAPQENADFESTSSVRRSRAESRRSKRSVQARAERKRAVREARVERPKRLDGARAQKRASLSPEKPRMVARREAARAVEAQHRAEPAPKLPAVERVHAGDVQPSKNTLPVSGLAESAESSLMDFVNQVRKALP